MKQLWQRVLRYQVQLCIIDEGMDTGEIIFQKAVDVLDGDTPETLQRRIMEQAEWKLLPKAINKIANEHVN